MQFSSTHSKQFSATLKRTSLLTLLLSQAFLAQAADFNIPAQALDKALNSLAKQSGERILFSTDLTEKITAPAVKGNLSTREALNALLKNSGLVLQGNSTQGYPIIKKPPQSQEREDILPEVAVTAEAEKETATSHVNGYVARRSATVTKTDTPIIETPQSISVVTADQMRNLNAQSLQDALGYTSGLASGTVAMNPAIADSFYLRGFQADSEFGSYYRDGMRFMSNIYNGKQEPYGLERIAYRSPQGAVFRPLWCGGPRRHHQYGVQTSPGDSFAGGQCRSGQF